MAVVIIEAETPEQVMLNLATSDLPFDRWFRRPVRAIHDLDLAQLPSTLLIVAFGPLPARAAPAASPPEPAELLQFTAAGLLSAAAYQRKRKRQGLSVAPDGTLSAMLDGRGKKPEPEADTERYQQEEGHRELLQEAAEMAARLAAEGYSAEEIKLELNGTACATTHVSAHSSVFNAGHLVPLTGCVHTRKSPTPA